MISQAELKSILHYDKEIGRFTWLIETGKARIGCEAGWIARMSSRVDSKYRFIGIGHKNYLAHRLAFLYMTGNFPNKFVDHINHDSTDNRWANLREATSTENNRNMRLRITNKSGICGVWLDRKIWVAKIGIKSKQVCLGRFNNLFDAVCARKNAEAIHGYHKNHGL